MKPAEILKRLIAKFVGETLSKSQVYDWSKLFRGRTEVENIRRLHILQGKL
jgi:hypothetical protein